MRKILFLALVMSAALAACKSSERPIPPPAFVAWCDGCGSYAEWLVLDDRLECSASGMAWEVKP